jgi:hypothetical protein
MQRNLPSTFETIIIPINVAGRLARKIAHGIAVVLETANMQSPMQNKFAIQFTRAILILMNFPSNGIITT